MLILAWASVAGAADEAALDAYMDQRLDVIEASVSTVYAKGYDGSGAFWFVVDHDGVTLDAVDFASRVGDPEIAARLRSRRRSSAGGGLALLGVGALGSTLAVLSAPGLLLNDQPPTTLFVGGIAGGLVGLTGGTLVLSGRVKQRHPAAAYTQVEATERVQAYNAKLRDEILGPP